MGEFKPIEGEFEEEDYEEMSQFFEDIETITRTSRSIPGTKSLRGFDIQTFLLWKIFKKLK